MPSSSLSLHSHPASHHKSPTAHTSRAEELADISRHAPERQLCDCQSYSLLSWMPPPPVRNCTVLPPPLTGPRSRSFSFLPTTATAMSVLTLPPEVFASKVKAAVADTLTLMPPPPVERFTASDNSEGSTALMEPPPVEASTPPDTFSMVRPPPPEVMCAVP